MCAALPTKSFLGLQYHPIVLISVQIYPQSFYSVHSHPHGVSRHAIPPRRFYLENDHSTGYKFHPRVLSHKIRPTGFLYFAIVPQGGFIWTMLPPQVFLIWPERDFRCAIPSHRVLFGHCTLHRFYILHRMVFRSAIPPKGIQSKQYHPEGFVWTMTPSTGF